MGPTIAATSIDLVLVPVVLGQYRWQRRGRGDGRIGWRRRRIAEIHYLGVRRRIVVRARGQGIRRGQGAAAALPAGAAGDRHRSRSDRGVRRRSVPQQQWRRRWWFKGERRGRGRAPRVLLGGVGPQEEAQVEDAAGDPGGTLLVYRSDRMRAFWSFLDVLVHVDYFLPVLTPSNPPSLSYF